MPTDETLPAGDSVAAVGAATIRARLPNPIEFGAWRITHRDYCLVSVRDRSGAVGRAWGLTRDGPVAQIIDLMIAPRYVGGQPDRADALRDAVLASNRAILSGGVGLRSLSLVDLATWDLAARRKDIPILALLGGEARPTLATAIIGYPPSLDEDGITAQVEGLLRAGWRRFKMPVGPSAEITIRRIRAAVGAAPGGEVSLDLAWTYRDAAAVADLIDRLGVRLGWIEDVMPPGEIDQLVALRSLSDTPVAMGDDQGGPYFPDALLAADALDVVRLDATCVGGVGPFMRASRLAAAAGKLVAPHMYGHVHGPLLQALGMASAPVEWSLPGTGVDPYGDALPMPKVIAGFSEPRAPEPGFGPTMNANWISEQQLTDPDGSLAW